MPTLQIRQKHMSAHLRILNHEKHQNDIRSNFLKFAAVTAEENLLEEEKVFESTIKSLLKHTFNRTFHDTETPRLSTGVNGQNDVWGGSMLVTNLVAMWAVRRPSKIRQRFKEWKTISERTILSCWNNYTLPPLLYSLKNTWQWAFSRCATFPLSTLRVNLSRISALPLSMFIQGIFEKQE